MAKTLIKHWRSSGSCWTKFVWTPTCGDYCENDTSRMFCWNLDGKNTELGMRIRSSKARFMLFGICGRHQNGGKEAEYGSHVEEIDEECRIGCTNIISWSRFFGMHSAWMRTKQKVLWNSIRVTYFWWSNGKLRGRDKNKKKAWSYDMEGHAEKCVGRYCELANKETEQLYKVSSFLLGLSSCQEGGTWIKWITTRILLSDSIEMLVSCTNWWARHSVVGEQTCSISY